MKAYRQSLRHRWNKRSKDSYTVTDSDQEPSIRPAEMASVVSSIFVQQSVSLVVSDDAPSFYPNIHICLEKAANIKSFIESCGFDHLTSTIHKMIATGMVVRNWVPFNFESFKYIPDDDERRKLRSLIDHVVIGSTYWDDAGLVSQALLSISLTVDNTFFYHLNTDGPLPQEIQLDSSDDSGAVASTLWTLPCKEFEGTWENLVFDSAIKNELISYAMSLATLSQKQVNTAIINVNRLMLLTGPPGTGKTSLCRGLAQILSVELSDYYSNSVMIEINSHSLFSKWFSESGKLVQKMFEDIDSLAENKRTMVFVLIDEVESLGMARDSSSTRGDPGDSIRAVNALLTQIDKVRRRPNVMLLCTSNLVNSLDGAFVDRADLVRFVGKPSSNAIMRILEECLDELERVNLVSYADDDIHCEKLLVDVARQAENSGLSGRSIRQIPALALSLARKECPSREEFISLFKLAIEKKSMDLPGKPQKKKDAHSGQNGIYD